MYVYAREIEALPNDLRVYMAREVARGGSPAAVARELNRKRVPRPSGKRWFTGVVIEVVHSMLADHGLKWRHRGDLWFPRNDSQ